MFGGQHCVDTTTSAVRVRLFSAANTHKDRAIAILVGVHIAIALFMVVLLLSALEVSLYERGAEGQEEAQEAHADHCRDRPDRKLHTQLHLHTINDVMTVRVADHIGQDNHAEHDIGSGDDQRQGTADLRGEGEDSIDAILHLGTYFLFGSQTKLDGT